MRWSGRRVGVLAALVVVGAAVFVGVSAASTRRVAQSSGPVFQRLWDRVAAPDGAPRRRDFRTPGMAVLGGIPSVLVGDSRGNLSAYAIASGASIRGWPVQTDAADYKSCPSNDPNCGYVVQGLASPPSSSPVAGGTEVVIEAGGGNNVPGAKNEPDFEAFSATGNPLYHGPNPAHPGTNPADETLYSKANPNRRIRTEGSVQGLSGVALAPVGGELAGFAGGTTSHSVYGIQAQSGHLLHPPLLNGDTSLQTPAVGSLGTGTPTLVYQPGDMTYDAQNGGGFSGGHLRIIEPSGAQVCNANIESPAPKDNFGGGGFGTAPAVGSLGGVPLVVIGEGVRWTASPHWTSSDQVLAFDAACQLQWKSPHLAGQTNFAPAIADVQGNGTPLVIEEVRTDRLQGDHPVIYELNGTGAIVRSTTLSGCKGIVPNEPTESVATADLSGQGYQDIIAPAGSCGYAVLDGRTLALVPAGQAARTGYLSPPCGKGRMQGDYTPLITATGSSDGTLAVTLTGPSSKGGSGCIFTYAVRGAPGHTAVLGDGWPEYHHDPALTGIASASLSAHPARDVLGPSATLYAGQQLVSANGRFSAVMQRDGNFVVYEHTASGQRALFDTATNRPPQGVKLEMQPDGNLVIYDAAGKPRWYSHTAGHDRPTQLVMQTDGNLVIYEGPRPGVKQISTPIWSTRTHVPGL